MSANCTDSFVGDLLVHRPGNADAADFGDAFQSRGDVDPIA
jgi:hypothetical protein